MAVLYCVWVPTVAFAHLLGLILLVYSLEKTSGAVSKLLRRLKRPNPTPDPESGLAKAVSLCRTLSLTASATSGVHHNAAFGMGETPKTSSKRGGQWLRGCNCEAGCICPGRWVRKQAPGDKGELFLTVPIPADLSWSGVTCQVLDRATLRLKQVLYPCSGIALPGETMALLGPSGAGKSTLLDILAARKSCGKMTGEVKMNGLPCGDLFRRISAYVAQEDVFVPTMTAWETLVFYATLTLPKAVSQEERTRRIMDVLQIMGLSRVRSTQVGGALPGGILVRGLSGGEKRRLNIACALLASPSILFLDEPTTGLDSFAALNVMEHMSELARVGHTVIASIHQPRAAIWDMFHKVTVLSEGYQLYCGRPEDALYWFNSGLGFSYNQERDGAVSDWLMDLVSVGFQKPDTFESRSMCSVEDVVMAYHAFQEERPSISGVGAHPRVLAKAPSLVGPATILASAVSGPIPTAAAPVVRQASNVSTHMVSPTTSLPDMERVESSLRSGSAVLADIEAHSPKAVKDQLSWASGRYAASWWTQFKVLLRRAMLAQLRNPTDATSRLFLATWVGLLGGLVFFNLSEGPEAVAKRLSLQFFILLLFELLPFCYMSFYVSDRKFFAADVASDLYHPSAYYMAAVVAGIPGVVLNTLSGTLTAYGLAGLRFDFMAIFVVCAIVCLQALISIQLQVFCVWLTPNQDLAYVLATGYVASSILLSGFYMRIADMQLYALRFLSYLSYTKYAMEGVSKMELSGIIYPGCSGSRLPHGFTTAAQSGNLAAAARLAGGQMGHPLPGATSSMMYPHAPGPAPYTSMASFPQAAPGVFTLPSTSSDLFFAAGGMLPECDTSGDSLLAFWGYRFSIGEVLGFLTMFYVLFHIGSYLALSKLYRQKR